jgi:hypothetical protein
VLSRALPFVVHAVSYAFSTVALLAMRTPFEEERERDRSPLRSRLTEGFRFLWDHPFLRACAFLYGLSNFIGPGVLLAVVVIGQRQGLSGGELGLLLSAFGACLLLGAFLSPLVRRLLPVRGVLLLELWTWVGCGLSSSGRTCTCSPRASSPPRSRSRRPTRWSTATSSR